MDRAQSRRRTSRHARGRSQPSGAWRMIQEPCFRRNGDAPLKAIAIILIVIGHEEYLTGPRLFNFLYNFHIWVFLLLPFCRPPVPLTARTVADLAARYLV